MIPLSGTPSDVSSNDDSGRLLQVWSLQDIQFQTNAAGVPVGTVVAKSDFGSDTETENSGVTTFQGTTDTVTSTTTPAGSAPPNDPPVSPPGGLLPSAVGDTETLAADAPPVPAESQQASVTSGDPERSILQNTWDFFFGRGAWLSDPWSQEYGHAYAPESIANPVAPVALFGQNMAALNDTMKENGVYTRAEGVVQFGTSIPEGIGGGAMMLSPEPILTKAGGAIILAVALDHGRVGFYKMIWGKNAETTVRTVAVSTAEALGADKNSAQWIGFGADVSSNVGSGVIAYRFAKAGHLADLADDVAPNKISAALSEATPTRLELLTQQSSRNLVLLDENVYFLEKELSLQGFDVLKVPSGTADSAIRGALESSGARFVTRNFTDFKGLEGVVRVSGTNSLAEQLITTSNSLQIARVNPEVFVNVPQIPASGLKVRLVKRPK